MNAIEKFLRSLSKKEHEALLLVMFQVRNDYRKIPGFIKLKGTKNLFRVRVGRFRIVFKIETKRTEIVRITKRNENTYKGL